MDWACGTYGGQEMQIRVLVGRPEGKRPLGRPWSRWEYNIEKDFQEVGWWGKHGLDSSGS
jgi:hypothetical protein